MAIGILDPRQALALKLYKSPTSETFGSLRGSLIAAGYDDEYANSISGNMPAWLSENMRNTVRMVQGAERNLKMFIEIDIPMKGKKSKNDIEMLKLKNDATKFVLKTLAKGKYGEDKEKTPPSVQINIVNYNEAKEGAPVKVHDVQGQ
jgi:hypothetical protein